MIRNMVQFKWREINRLHIPEQDGVYAWYYLPLLGDADVQRVIAFLDESNCVDKKKEYITNFLSKYIFDFYREEPYDVTIKGALKPRFAGQVAHVDQVSDALVIRILERPSILYEVKSDLAEIGIEFASPLYIGMSGNLCSRLMAHKNLIESYKEFGIPDEQNGEKRDHDFAARIVNRGYLETNLIVAVKTVSSESGLHNIMENVLNRINYPILGRN